MNMKMRKKQCRCSKNLGSRARLSIQGDSHCQQQLLLHTIDTTDTKFSTLRCGFLPPSIVNATVTNDQ